MRHHAFQRIVQHPLIAKIAYDLFDGHRCYLTHGKVSFKFPGQDTSWFPHQDNGYRHFVGRQTRSGHTFVVLLDDVTATQGPLELLPGSHKRGVLEHRRVVEAMDGSSQIVLAQDPEGDFTSFTGKRGDIAIFTSETVHRSGSNNGKSFRPIFIFECEKFSGRESTEIGTVPLVLGGEVAARERVLVSVLGLKRRALTTVAKLPGAKRLYRQFVRSR